MVTILNADIEQALYKNVKFQGHYRLSVQLETFHREINDQHLHNIFYSYL